MCFLHRDEGFLGVWVQDTEKRRQRDRAKYQKTENICANRACISKGRWSKMEMMLRKE